MTRWKVLVADDEYWVRENLVALLEGLGDDLEVLPPAADGEEALARIIADRPDLLVTDINMPFLGGNDLIRAAVTEVPELQVVVVSGYADFAYVRQALVDGAVDYLLKPVTRETLAGALNKALDPLRGPRSPVASTDFQPEDRALSDLLQEGAATLPRELAVLDLEFRVFTLLVVRVLGLPRSPADRIRALVRREMSGPGKSLVFQNLGARGEFLVLTDRDGPEVTAAGHRLADHLEKLTGGPVDVGASAPFYAFSRVTEAYRQARAALMTRTAGEPGGLVEFDRVKGRPVQGRVPADAEKLLVLAITSGDRALIREAVFDRVGLGPGARDWLLLEVRQTVSHLAALMVQHAPALRAAPTGLALEAFQAQVDRALEARDLGEVGRLMGQWIDEFWAEAGQPGTSPTMRQVVRQVQEAVTDRYCENLTLAALAQGFRVDPSYLSKAFKQVTGSNLMAALTHRRIEKAQEFIRDRDLSLTDVAALVGYDDYAYFNRVFHKVTGTSPTDYRNRHRRPAHAPS